MIEGSVAAAGGAMRRIGMTLAFEAIWSVIYRMT
jgi:hypothetical protein